MIFNLLKEPWLPVRRKSGKTDFIAVWEIGEGGDDPPVDVAPPRHDFRQGLLEFLVGLMQTAMPPESKSKWRERLETPPSSAEMQTALARFEPYFNLMGDKPLFLQDLELDPEEHAGSSFPIGALLMNNPGKDAFDLFVKQGSVECLCPSCAAMALFTMQAFAPAGGAGIRVSMRGGGPLSTLAVQDLLWGTLWSNVMNTSSRGVESPPDDAGLPGAVFPWAVPTRTSDNGEPFHRADGHFLHQYWGMPRRILLLPEESDPPEACSVCGRDSSVLIRRFIQRPRGYNYAEDWMHPLTPYRRQSPTKPWFSVKGAAHAVGYVNYAGTIYGGENSEPALCVRHYRKMMRQGGKPDRVLAAGYDMDKMKPLRWCEGRFPVLPLDGEDLKNFMATVEALVQAANDVRSNLTNAVRKAILHDKNAARSNALGTSFFGNLVEEFWSETTAAFYALTEEAAKGPSADETAALNRRWMQTLWDQAEVMFHRTADQELGHPVHARRAVKALEEMRRFNQTAFKKHFAQTLKKDPAANAEPTAGKEEQ